MKSFRLLFQTCGVAAVLSLALAPLSACAAPQDSPGQSVTLKSGTSQSVRRVFLGLELQPVTTDIARVLALPDENGAWVFSVVPAGPAEQAGIEAGDVVLKFQDESITTAQQLLKAIATQEPGVEVALQVWRNGKTLNLRARLSTPPTEFQMASPGSCTGKPQALSFTQAIFYGPYLGECNQAGLAHGRGRATGVIPFFKTGYWLNEVEKNIEKVRAFAYYGEFREGVPQGSGTLIAPAGTKIGDFELKSTYKYSGEFAYGRPTGKGIVHYKGAKLSLSPDLLRKQWGILPEVMQNKWLTQNIHKSPVSYDFAWILPGLVMQQHVNGATSEGMYDRVIIHYNETNESLSLIAMRLGNTWVGNATSDGSVLFEKDGLLKGNVRITKTENGFKIENDGLMSLTAISRLNNPSYFYPYSEEAAEQMLAQVSAEVRAEKAESAAFWNNMAAGMGAMARGAAQVSQEYAAQRARSDALNQSIQQSRDIAAAKERDRIANDQARLNSKQSQQTAQYQASSRSQNAASNRQAAPQGQDVTKAVEQPKRVIEQQAQIQASVQQPARQAVASPTSTTSSNTSAADYWAARRAGIDKPESDKSTAASRGPARAWCRQDKEGAYWCSGPFQNNVWGETLELALNRSGCAGGTGYSPKVGQGGSSFNCGRELKPGEIMVPTYDPFYRMNKDR
ncbi:PDZ domain-containing protein [Paucimonas lemoignei]|nr:PDZ domain-containing protein [Paucimonas lemoignei]